MEEALQKLIEFVENASPVIWQALVKQAYVDAVGQLLGAIFFGFMALQLFKVAKGRLKRVAEMKGANADPKSYDLYSDMDSQYFMYAGSTVGWVLSFVITLSNIYAAIGRFINPNYYAIQMILEQFK